MQQHSVPAVSRLQSCWRNELLGRAFFLQTGDSNTANINRAKVMTDQVSVSMTKASAETAFVEKAIRGKLLALSTPRYCHHWKRQWKNCLRTWTALLLRGDF